MENNNTLENTNWMEPKKRGTFLTVLLVLLFVGVGLGTIFSLFGLQKSAEQSELNGISPVFTYISLVCSVLIIVSGILMWQRKMVGLILYLIFKVAQLVVIFITMPTNLRIGFETGGMENAEMLVQIMMVLIVFLWAIFPVLFLVNLKEFRKPATSSDQI